MARPFLPRRRIARLAACIRQEIALEILLQCAQPVQGARDGKGARVRAREDEARMQMRRLCREHSGREPPRRPAVPSVERGIRLHRLRLTRGLRAADGAHLLRAGAHAAHIALAREAVAGELPVQEFLRHQRALSFPRLRPPDGAPRHTPAKKSSDTSYTTPRVAFPSGSGCTRSPLPGSARRPRSRGAASPCTPTYRRGASP